MAAAAVPYGNQWNELLDGRSRVVLVANSEDVSRERLNAFADDTLFVFFNRVFKVLDTPFGRPAVLVSRCSPAGPNLVHRREVGSVLPLLEGPSFAGVILLRSGADERFAAPNDTPEGPFAPHRVRRLDLTEWLQGAYPPNSVPTSGFAFALWLAAVRPELPVTLLGFSAKRSERWKLFDDHDWGYEQIALAGLARAGMVERIGLDAAEWPFEELRRRVSGLPAPDPLDVARVLSERQRGTNLIVDRLWSIVRPLRALDGAYRKLRPATRKERLARNR